MKRIFFITTVVLTICSNSIIAQADKYVSTGYCMLRQGAWDKDWVANSDASFSFDLNLKEIRFEHTNWAPHTLKVDRIENLNTEEGVPLVVYHCTESANGDKWELRFNEWTVFDEAVRYYYYQIELKSPSATMKFMTKKADL